MKSIGIKQADGTFYPILEENTVCSKQLVLTTVQDNQTTVQIDLYRSETNSMEDAEYVDTLQIKNLEPHPNGEPDLQLNVSLDENNELHAEVDDPETGKSSKIQVALITRSEEERASDLPPVEIDENLNLDAISADNEAEVNEMIGPSPNEEEFSFDDIDAVTPAPETEDTPVEQEENTNIDLSDFDTIPLQEDTPAQEPVVEEFSAEEPAVEEPSVEEPSVETFAAEEPAVEEPVIEESVEEEPSADIFDTSALDEALGEENVPDESEIDIPVTDDSFSTDFAAETSEIFNAADLDEPPVTSADEEIVEEKSSDIFSTGELDKPFFNEIPEDGEEEETEEDNTSIFDLPDFPIENSVEEQPATDDLFDTSELDEQPVPETSFADNSLADEPVFDEPVAEESSAINFDDSTFDDSPFDEPETTFAPTQDNSEFSDLYDKETMEGASSYDYAEEAKRKTKKHVIICLICAIICIIAALLVLFVIPSPCNLRMKKAKKAAEKPAVILDNKTETVEEPVAPPEPVKIEETVQAKEDEIVVATTPEVIVPETPAKPAEKPADIRYKIKWGDTLWDISNAYYKNPWRYKMLAKYNNIKNPNLIISGTYINIPAE